MKYPNCKGCYADKAIGRGCKLLSKRFLKNCPFYTKDYDFKTIENDIAEYSGKGRARRNFDYIDSPYETAKPEKIDRGSARDTLEHLGEVDR